MFITLESKMCNCAKNVRVPVLSRLTSLDIQKSSWGLFENNEDLLENTWSFLFSHNIDLPEK